MLKQRNTLSNPSSAHVGPIQLIKIHNLKKKGLQGHYKQLLSLSPPIVDAEKILKSSYIFTKW